MLTLQRHLHPDCSLFCHPALLRARRTIIFFTLILIPLSGIAQQYLYSINKDGTCIGKLSVACSGAGNQLAYSIHSNAKVRFIFEMNVDVLIEETFDSGHLKNSTFIRKVNGREKINNTACKIQDSYQLTNNSNPFKIYPSPIDYTMGAMYFIEPGNRHFVYSELYQQLIPVISLGGNRYLVEFPNGNKSYYTYRNGMCTSIEVHVPMTILVFKIDKNLLVNAIATDE